MSVLFNSYQDVLGYCYKIKKQGKSRIRTDFRTFGSLLNKYGRPCYTEQHLRLSGLCPLSLCLYRNHNISEIESISVFRWTGYDEIPTLFGQPVVPLSHTETSFRIMTTGQRKGTKYYTLTLEESHIVKYLRTYPYIQQVKAYITVYRLALPYDGYMGAIFV